MLSVGIIGLPNVGKSTLFNALTAVEAEVSNYPFTTIDPNVGVVEVPDPRLDELARVLAPEKVTPATVQFIDVAGLVEGASHGEGLGNRFLGEIRAVDAESGKTLWSVSGEKTSGYEGTSLAVRSAVAAYCTSEEVVCLDRVAGGYCTHECTGDPDCCAVPDECWSNLVQVCAPFESTGERYCFLGCEDADIADGTARVGADPSIGADEYCARYAHPSFHCRSTGGGAANRRVCVP